MAPDPIFFSASHGVFAPTGHARGPWDADALHGGAPAALLVRAIEGLGTGLALGRLTIDYLGPVPLAPLTVAASVVRPGRRFAVAEATVEADGQRRCFARAMLVRREPVALPPHWSPPAPPSLAAPEEGEPSQFPVEGAVGFDEAFHLTAFDIRFVGGDYHAGPADVWFRLRRPLSTTSRPRRWRRWQRRRTSATASAHVLDFERFLFVNLDLGIQITRAPAGEWIGLAARTELGDDGTGVARSVLHDVSGPVGSASQTLFVAPR